MGGRVRVLVDTHMVLWWFAGDAKMPRTAIEILQDAGNDVLVSAASVWEIGTKARLGKLPHALPLARDLPARLSGQGFEVLPMTGAHAHRAAWLAGEHRDPFDRMIAAQALVEGISIVSVDPCFDAWGIPRLA